MKSIRTILKINLLAPLVLFISIYISSCKSTNTEEVQTNFVIIYLDDMGYGDLALTGAVGYKTPNLDKVASKGMVFTNFYAPQAVCSASRAGLLTGCYPNRVGIIGALGVESDIGINDKEETLAELLKKKGYATAIYGKWHLGHHPQFLPTRHGFDEFYGIPYSNDMWPLHPKNPQKYPGLPLYENEKIVNDSVTQEGQEHFTTEFTERAVSFIQKNQETPFFLYLAHPQPHVPLFVSDKFKGKSRQGLYGDVMMEIDWSVGKIIQTLDDLGLSQNTLVIFTSDNGPWLNYGNHAGSAGGLREGKGSTFEGGQRVPGLMLWKGVIPGGTVCNNIVSAIDIFPTIATISGSPLPDNKIDGVNLLPLLKGDFESNPRTTYYYYYYRNNLRAVRHNDWKLVFSHRGRSYEGFEPGRDGKPGEVNNGNLYERGLYDLRRDPGERYNMLEFYPEIEKELEKIADKARDDLGDNLTGNVGESRREPGRYKLDL